MEIAVSKNKADEGINYSYIYKLAFCASFLISQYEVRLTIFYTERLIIEQNGLLEHRLGNTSILRSYKNNQAIEMWDTIVPQADKLKSESVQAARAALSKSLL